MSPFTIALAQAEDAAEILALQEINHVSTVPPENLASGFVTTQLTQSSLEEIQANHGMWVARAADGKLAAYACANPWSFYGDGPFISAAMARLPQDFDGQAVEPTNSFQYGPVCVAGAFRGQGVLEQLVGAIKAHYAPNFAFGITFVDVRNARSLAAHERKLGFRRIAELPFLTVVYHMLAFSTR